MADNPNQYKLSEEEHQTIFECEIKPDLLRGVNSTSQPIAVIFGGQPGAGKSAAVDEAIRELHSRGGAVQIIGDDLRDYHPKYEQLMEADDKTAAFYTDRDSGKWVEKAIAEAKLQRVNLVIEGTMRDGAKVAETMNSLREAGYQIDARALAVNEKISQQGILLRYEHQKADRGSGRLTTPQAHQAAYEGMLKTIERIESEKLADRVTIYRRGDQEIYSNELKGGDWIREPRAREIIEAERARPMTLEERQNYIQGFAQLAEMLAKPERQASAEEITRVSNLHRQAVKTLTSAEEMGHGEQMKVATSAAKNLQVHRDTVKENPAYGLISLLRSPKITTLRNVLVEKNKELPESAQTSVKQESRKVVDSPDHGKSQVESNPKISSGDDYSL